MTISERTARLTIDITLAVVCALGAVMALVDLRTPVRPYVVLVAVVAGTGWAATGWITVGDAAYAGTIALATGLAVPMLVGLFFVEIHWWHPVGTAGALLLLAAALNAGVAVRDLRRRVAP